MAKQSRALDERLFVAPKRKAIPHAFVLDAIAEALPVTRPMFGCTAVYVKEKIVLVLRDKPSAPDDNGVWLATTAEHHASLRREFPNMPKHVSWFCARPSNRENCSPEAKPSTAGRGPQ